MRKILLFTLTGCVLFNVVPYAYPLIAFLYPLFCYTVGVLGLIFLAYVTWMHVRAENTLINAHGLKKGRKLYQNGVMAEWINNRPRWDV